MLVSGRIRWPIKCDRRYLKRSVYIRKYTATLRMRISLYAVIDTISAIDRKKCLGPLGKMDCRGGSGMEGKKDSEGKTKFCRG